MVNWSLAVIADRGLSYTLHSKEKPQTELLSSCLLNQPLQGSFWYHLPNNGQRPAPPNHLHYTDQSEWFYNNQSELKSLATQDSVIWTNQNTNFDSSFA